jgi:hypothetical protein
LKCREGLRHACWSSDDDHIKTLAQLTLQLQQAARFSKLTT